MIAEVSRKRAAFTPVKAGLRRVGYQFSLCFPAKLRVIAEGSRNESNTPAEAAVFVEA